MAQQPDHGARFSLCRREADTDSAAYEAEILTADRTFSYAVSIHIAENRQISVAVTTAEDPFSDHNSELSAPEWAVKYLTTLAKQLGKGAVRNQKWTRRLLRWRGV